LVVAVVFFLLFLVRVLIEGLGQERMGELDAEDASDELGRQEATEAPGSL